MKIGEAIAAPELILAGSSASDGAIDHRWQAIIAVADFIETEPEAVWAFTRR